MKKFYITNPETTERYAVYFDFENSKFSDVLGASYIMETSGNPVTNNDDDAPTLAELKAQATSEIMDTDADDDEYLEDTFVAWGIMPKRHIEYALYVGEDADDWENEPEAFDTLRDAFDAAKQFVSDCERGGKRTIVAEITKINTETGDYLWDSPIVFFSDGGCWTLDPDASAEKAIMDELED